MFEIVRKSTGEIVASFESKEALNTWMRSQDWVVLVDADYDVREVTEEPIPSYRPPEQHAPTHYTIPGVSSPES